METGTKPELRAYASYLLKGWEDSEGRRRLPFSRRPHTALCVGEVADKLVNEYYTYGSVDRLITAVIDSLNVLADPELVWNVNVTGALAPVCPYEEGTYEYNVFFATYHFIERYL